MQTKEKIWTEEKVILAFEEAIRTLRKLPTSRIQGYFNSWPQVIYKEIEILRMQKKPIKLSATPESVARLEKVCVWINFLNEADDRKLIWLRAARTPWKIICNEFGVSRATANRKWKNSIVTIMNNLE